jgi:hypothetical protein
MATGNWRLIDVDALDPENAFSPELLAPQFTSQWKQQLLHLRVYT